MAYPPDPVEARGELVVGRMEPLPVTHPRYVVTVEVEVEVYEPDETEAVKEVLASLDADAAVVSCSVHGVRLEAT